MLSAHLLRVYVTLERPLRCRFAPTVDQDRRVQNAVGSDLAVDWPSELKSVDYPAGVSAKRRIILPAMAASGMWAVPNVLT